MNTIDVDVGGTFTDLVLTLDGETSYRKVPTTPYDLSVGFMQVVEEAARARPGLSLDDLVRAGRDRPLLDHGGDEPAARALAARGSR